MVKVTKSDPKQPESFGTGLEQVRMKLLVHAQRLSDHLDSLAEDMEVVDNPDKGMHYAAMLHKHAQIVGELRKHESGSAANMTRADVLNWARKLEGADLQSFVRECQQFAAKRSGLA